MAYPFTEEDLKILRSRNENPIEKAKDQFALAHPDFATLAPNTLAGDFQPSEYRPEPATVFPDSKINGSLLSYFTGAAKPELIDYTGKNAPMADGTENQGLAPEESFSGENVLGGGTSSGLLAGLTSGSDVSSRNLSVVKGNKSPDSLPLNKEVQLSPEPVEAPFEGLQFGQNDIGNQENLRAAMEARNFMNLLSTTGKAGDMIGAAITGTKRGANPVYEDIDKQAAQVVPDFEKQVDFQKNDPNSAYAQGLKDYFKNKLGMEIRGDATPAELEKIMPLAVREFEAQAQREATAQQRSEDRAVRAEQYRREDQFRRDKMQEDAELKRELKGMEVDKAKTLAAEKAEGKKSDAQTKFIDKATIRLDKHGKSLGTLRRAKSMIDEAVKNPSSIKDVSSLYQYISALDPESVVREGEVQLANKASGYIGSLKLSLQQMTTNPRLITDKNLKQIQEEIEKLHKLTEDEYDLKRQTSYKEAKRLGISEEDFGNFDSYYTPKVSGDEHAEALDWAKKHPDDPRAKKILKHHEGK